MSILQNAIDSIEIGLEDYKHSDPRRLASSVRNFYAGILLLFKHKLALLSDGDDEALLKSNVLPEIVDGDLRWVGKGRKTVDVQQIQERFKSLGVQVSWERMREIQNYRNNIEHYFDTARPEVVRQYIVACFIVVRDFIVDHLEADPKEVLGETTWACLVEEEQVYSAEKEACREKLGEVEWHDESIAALIDYFECTECGSKLMEPSEPDSATPKVKCRVCDYETTVDELLPAACAAFNWVHDYEEVKYGGHHSFVQCPECGEQTYNTEEDRCISSECECCGPFECARCGNTIGPDEFEWGETTYCSYCADKVSSYSDE
ncbi:MAG: hypothetical protein RIC55_24425 [Pirellulaceae bacterium]